MSLTNILKMNYIMGNIVGHINDKILTLKALRILPWMHTIYQPTLFNIGGQGRK